MNMKIRMSLMAFTLLPASLAMAAVEMKSKQMPWMESTQMPGTVPSTEMMETQLPGTVPSETMQLNRLTNSMVINFIHHLNSKEIQVSQEALGKLQNAQLRQFAEMLIADHRQNEERLLQLAAQKNVTVGTFEPATHEIMVMNELRSMEGMAFDRGFWQVQLQVYQQGIQSLQLMLSSITDPEVQAFISSTIPTLQSHLDDATAIQIGVQFE